MSLANLLFKHPAYFIGLGFGSGLSRFAPGTVGTLWAWALFLIFKNIFNFNFGIIFLLFSFFLGIWACSLTSIKLKKNDPSEIVIDEIVAFWFVLALLPSFNDPMGGVVLAGLSEWFIQFLAFIFFRIFDIFKPVRISWIDKNIKGGLGIMLDDIVAGGLTLLLISLFLKVYAFVVFI